MDEGLVEVENERDGRGRRGLLRENWGARGMGARVGLQLANDCERVDVSGVVVCVNAYLPAEALVPQVRDFLATDRKRAEYFDVLDGTMTSLAWGCERLVN